MMKNTQKVTVIGTHYKGFGAGKSFQKTFKNEAEMEKWASSEVAINHYHIEAYSFYQGGR
jgi:hypothetical protein